jgi:hypothetical protein
MDHEAYERAMRDVINKHAETAQGGNTVNGIGKRVVTIGLKRTLLALLTVATFVLAVIGLIAVAFVKGYLAVLLFFISIVALVCSYTLLCAQGITDKLASESKGESK